MIMKLCKKHGKLTLDQVHPKGKSLSGKQYYGCNLCKKINAKKFYENNFESIRLSNSKYHQKRKSTKEFKEKKKKWMHDYQKRRRLLRGDELREKNRKQKLKWSKLNREKLKMKMREMSANLHPSYVKSYLKVHYGFENPTNELIHAKATIMLLKREIMKINVNQGKNKYVAKTRKYKRGSASRDAEQSILEGSTEDFIQCKVVSKTTTNNESN